MKRLAELFERIDTDGSGGVDWLEFSEFCIESGKLSTMASTKPIQFEVRYSACAFNTRILGMCMRVSSTFVVLLPYVCGLYVVGCAACVHSWWCVLMCVCAKTCMLRGQRG